MHEVLVETTPPSRVLIGCSDFGNLDPSLIDLVVADRFVYELHQKRLAGLGQTPVLLHDRGESAKSFAQLERLLSGFADAGLDRQSTVLAFGGGVTSDLTGLAAALYMRGVNFATIPTTLLAQVDASVGGKTAINLAQGKNLVGAFHQPTDVLIDTELLHTLDLNEWRSGMGEVLKSALLGARLETGELLFEHLEALEADLRASQVITPIVHACVAFKAKVVSADLTERGPREQLNLGHTFGHAIEHLAGYGAIPHGVAVAAGLAMALERARETGVLEAPDLIERTARLAAKLELPASLGQLEGELGLSFEPERLLAAMGLDKKAADGQIRFVLPRAIGRWTTLGS